MELGLLFDTSSSYGMGEQRNKVGEFVKKFLEFYNIGPSGTLLSVVIFSQEVKILFRNYQKKYLNHDAAAEAIVEALAQTQPCPRPWTEKALVKAHDVLFTKGTSHPWKALFVFAKGKTPSPELCARLVGSIEVRLKPTQ